MERQNFSSRSEDVKNESFDASKAPRAEAEQLSGRKTADLLLV